MSLSLEYYCTSMMNLCIFQLTLIEGSWQKHWCRCSFSAETVTALNLGPVCYCVHKVVVLSLIVCISYSATDIRTQLHLFQDCLAGVAFLNQDNIANFSVTGVSWSKISEGVDTQFSLKKPVEEWHNPDFDKLNDKSSKHFVVKVSSISYYWSSSWLYFTLIQCGTLFSSR